MKTVRNIGLVVLGMAFLMSPVQFAKAADSTDHAAKAAAPAKAGAPDNADKALVGKDKAAAGDKCGNCEGCKKCDAAGKKGAKCTECGKDKKDCTCKHDKKHCKKCDMKHKHGDKDGAKEGHEEGHDDDAAHH